MAVRGILPRHAVRGILPRRRPPAPSAGWWAYVLPLAMMLASDYKLRSRDVDNAVSGSADLTVLVEIAIYGAAGLYVVWKFGLRLPRRRTTGLLLALWLFSGYVAFSALWSPYKSLGIVRGVQLMITVLVAHTVATRATPADLRKLAHIFIGIVLVSVGIGVAHPFPRTQNTETRFNWLYVHPVIAGVYLAVAILLVVGYLIRWNRPQDRLWHPVVYVAALAVLTGALIATGTRGAALGCAAGLAVLLFTARGPKGRIDVLVMGAAVAVLGVLAFSDKILEFVSRGETTQQLATLNSRTELWSLAMDAFKQEPIFGWGLGASRGLFLDSIGLGGGHNAFVNAMVDGGVFGTVVFSALLLTVGLVLLTLCRHRALRPDAGMLLGIFACFLADSMTTEGLEAPANVSSAWLFIMVAWAETLRRHAAGAAPGVQQGPADALPADAQPAGFPPTGSPARSGTTVTATAYVEGTAQER